MKTERNSSFELLRIILILLILIEHGNMWFIGSSSQSDAEHLARTIIESICIGSVNAFILISGWFGIRNGMKKFGSLTFVLLFTTIPPLLTAIATGYISLSSLLSLDAIYLYVLGGEGYWFVVAYLGLILIAPLLNSSIDALPERTLRQILTFTYGLIIIYDFVFRTTITGTAGGYSVTWFAWLYMLGAYMRRYNIRVLDKYPWWIMTGCVAIQSFLFYNGLIGLRYTNPFILAEAVCLIFIFSRYDFYNKTVNYIAGGCLMAYLIHMQPLAVGFISHTLSREYNAHGYWAYMAETVALSAAVLLLAVLLNSLQSIIYNSIFSSHRKRSL